MEAEQSKEVEIYDPIEIVFQPKKLKTLRPEFTELIGTRMTVRYGWTMYKDDQNPGQRAFVVEKSKDASVIGLWLPEEDMERIMNINTQG